MSRALATRWAALPKVRALLDAMEADVEGAYRQRIKRLAETAMDTIEEVMLDTAQPGAARIAAAKAVLDRVLPARGELEVRGHIEVHAIARLTVEQLAEEEARLQRDLEAIDGEAEVVSDA